LEELNLQVDEELVPSILQEIKKRGASKKALVSDQEFKEIIQNLKKL
jgi:isopropylmalate/homocitrate/citramalate synthase